VEGLREGHFVGFHTLSIRVAGFPKARYHLHLTRHTVKMEPYLTTHDGMTLNELATSVANAMLTTPNINIIYFLTQPRRSGGKSFIDRVHDALGKLQVHKKNDECLFMEFGEKDTRKLFTYPRTGIQNLRGVAGNCILVDDPKSDDLLWDIIVPLMALKQSQVYFLTQDRTTPELTELAGQAGVTLVEMGTLHRSQAPLSAPA
jgi:hypothetical protein